MKATVLGAEYLIQFQHFTVNRPIYSFKNKKEVQIISEATRCEIVTPVLGVASGYQQVTSAVVFRYWKDRSDREQARKYAILKAVESKWPRPKKVGHIDLHRVTRTAILSAYFNRKRKAVVPKDLPEQTP